MGNRTEYNTEYKRKRRMDPEYREHENRLRRIRMADPVRAEAERERKRKPKE